MFKRMLSILLVVLTLLSMCAVASVSVSAEHTHIAETGAKTVELSGTIKTNTMLNDPNCTYTLTGDVSVAFGVTLTIENGVTINSNYLYNLNVYGTLIAKNSIFNDVSILANNKDYEPCTINLTGCTFNDGRVVSHAYCYLNLKNNYFNSLDDELNIWYPQGTTYIEGNVFDNCPSIDVGSKFDVYVRYNTFKNIKNALFGYEQVISNWHQDDNSECYLQYNNIYPSSNAENLVGIKAGGGYNYASIIATYNYWGTTDANKVSDYIFDENDDRRESKE